MTATLRSHLTFPEGFFIFFSSFVCMRPFPFAEIALCQWAEVGQLCIPVLLFITFKGQNITHIIPQPIKLQHMIILVVSKRENISARKMRKKKKTLLNTWYTLRRQKFAIQINPSVLICNSTQIQSDEYHHWSSTLRLLIQPPTTSDTLCIYLRTRFALFLPIKECCENTQPVYSIN